LLLLLLVVLVLVLVLLVLLLLLLLLAETAHVEFKEAKGAAKAAQKCVNVNFKDRKINASLKPDKKDGRLIIRNLQFQVYSLSSAKKSSTLHETKPPLPIGYRGRSE